MSPIEKRVAEEIRRVIEDQQLAEQEAIDAIRRIVDEDAVSSPVPRPPRFGVSFKVNATAIVLGVMVAILAVAMCAKWIDAHGDKDAIRQLKGDLTAKEQALVKFDSDLRKAESEIVNQASLNLAYAAELDAIKRKTGNRNLNVNRASNSTLRIDGEIAPGNAQAGPGSTEGGRVEYRYALPWFSFYTPNALASGGEKLTFDMRAKLRVLGIRQSKDGVLETETVDLRFVDPNGDTIPLTVTVEDYRLEYAPVLPETVKWYDGVHLSAFARAGVAGYPSTPVYGRVAAGLDLRLWYIDALAWGEFGTDAEMRAMFGVGSQWQLF